MVLSWDRTQRKIFISLFFYYLVVFSFCFLLKVTVKAAAMGAIPGSAMVYFVY